jgi:predicted SnoaL-like aldol condensation-catalyzing enzyme
LVSAPAAFTSSKEVRAFFTTVVAEEHPAIRTAAMIAVRNVAQGRFIGILLWSGVENTDPGKVIILDVFLRYHTNLPFQQAA